MRSAPIPRLAAFLVWLAACGGENGEAGVHDAGPGEHGTDGGQVEGQADASPPVAICDGSDELRLAALFGSGNRSPASTTSSANGHPFVYVDGSCRYWTSGLQGQALSGILDDEAEERLTSELIVASWSSFHDGDWSGDRVDAPPLVLWQPDGRVTCYLDCDGQSVPEPLVSIGGRLRAESERLAAEAQPLDGPMRAMAIEGPLDSFPTGSPVFEWIYEPPVASFSYRDDEGSTGAEPGLIDDPEAVTALRQAWFDAREQGDFFLPVRDEEGLTYRLFARDVLPFEPETPWGVELPE